MIFKQWEGYLEPQFVNEVEEKIKRLNGVYWVIAQKSGNKWPEGTFQVSLDIKWFESFEENIDKIYAEYRTERIQSISDKLTLSYLEERKEEEKIHKKYKQERENILNESRRY